MRTGFCRALDTSRHYQHLQARFVNKPILKPIRAKEVQTRHQIDLVNMNKRKVKYGEATHTYILTVQDVFSRYVWLKSQGKVAVKLPNTCLPSTMNMVLQKYYNITKVESSMVL